MSRTQYLDAPPHECPICHYQCPIHTGRRPATQIRLLRYLQDHRSPAHAVPGRQIEQDLAVTSNHLKTLIYRVREAGASLLHSPGRGYWLAPEDRTLEFLDRTFPYVGQEQDRKDP